MRRQLAIVVSWLSTAPISAQAPTQTPSGGVARVGSVATVSRAPVIDGKLGQEEWQQGQVFTDFVQRDPREGAPISERTEVRILTDGEALYVGAWLFDRESSGIVMSEKLRDVTLTNSDYFGFILDTYLDRQNGFLFGTTPSGIEHDAQVVREGEGGGAFQQGQTRAQSGSMGGVNLNWDASWTVATSVDSLGWYAEFRIPFSTLRYGGGAKQVWGFNMMRGIRRKNEEGVWSRVPRQFGITRLSQAGTLQGLEVPVRRVATATPYVLGASSRVYATQSKFAQPTEWGVDAKYGITPSLTLDLTYNTDFAQVEVDEQRTNLTRFQLFFPEKRPFFLENAGVFSAGTPQAADLFFTRRIGIDAATGQPQPIVGGGRLTGRVGGLTVGAMQLFTDDVGALNGNSFTVARALKEVSARSRIGLIGVQRVSTRDVDDYNRTYGIDGRLGLGQDWTVDTWAALTETDSLGNDVAFSGRVAYQTREWNSSARFLQVGEDFNPEVGFMSRPAGHRFYDVSAMRLVRNPGWKRVRQWNPHMNFRGAFGLDGFYQTGTIHVDMTEVELHSGTRFGPEVNFQHEGLEQDFAIVTADSASGRRAVVIPKGSYDWATLGFDFFTNASAPVSLTGRADVGQFYTGTRRGGNVNLTARRGATISSTLILDYQDIRLDEGEFIRKLLGLKVAYFFTPRVFVQSLTQFNNQQRIWTGNLRFAWLNTAGTGLFVVFNSGETADGFFRHREHVARSFVVKYTRQIGTGG